MDSIMRFLRGAGLAVVTLALLALVNLQVNAKQPGDGNGGGGGGGGSTLGHWANYGTVTQYVTCTTVTFTLEIIGGVPTVVETISIVQKPVFYQQDHCDPSGSDCTLGTSRLTYQGGGC